MNHQPSPTDQSKNHTKRYIIIGLVVLFLLLAAFGGSSSDNPTNTTTNPSASAEASTEAPTQPQARKTWVKVAELSGTTNKRGDVFELNGGKQRIVYTVAGQYSPYVNIYVIPEGNSLERDGGFPEVTMASVSGETLMYKGAGRHYLDVSGNGDWTVAVEEER
ncbi:hypothetical protein [Rhodococcus aetherivorans]|uniref:hypothetical protein n=1 Tax=Rhodococcus aetherivorans TaxID=191292 RepID=UPI002948E2D3|nr:hypothetical protein [Rhodococcus aetherivorans]MDV6295208.1 hypothetical protein [Rhodococcus aetherivorans]